MAEGTNVGSIYYDLNLDDKKYQEGKARVKSGNEELGGSFGKLVGAISLGNIVSNLATTAWGGLQGAVTGLFQAADEAQTQQAQLNAALTSTHGAAGMTAASVNELAEEQQKLTPISKDATLASENMLLTFTSVGKDVFPEATKSIADMATRMNNGLTPSAEQLSKTTIQVGKALQDPINGITALHKVGVNFSEQQKEQIKNFVETGHQADAQKLILAELSKEFGGSASAAAKTYAGHLEQIKNNMHEAQVQIGTSLETAFAPLAAKLADFVSSDKFQNWLKEATKWLSDNLPKAINFITNTVLPALAGAFKTLEPTIKLAFDVFKSLFDFADHHKTLMKEVAIAILAVWSAFKIVEGAKAIINGIKAAWVAFQIIMEMNPIVLLITAIIVIVLEMALHWKAVQKVAGEVVRAIGDFFKGLWNWFSSNWPLLLAILFGPFGLAVLWIVQHWNQITDFFKRLPGMIGGFLSGIGNAITAPFRAAFDWVSNEAKKVGDALSHLNPFARHSPSLIDNIQAGSKVIVDQYGQMFDKIKQMPGSALFGQGGASLNVTGSVDQQMKFANITLNGDINFSNKDDVDYFFKKLGRNTQLASQGVTGIR